MNEPNQQPVPRRKPSARREPSKRDCHIYERHVLAGESHEALAAAFQISRQRVAQVIAKVEGWLGGHPDHALARQMRVRLMRRWETLWNETMAGFLRSRQDRKVVTERMLPPVSGSMAEEATVVVERTVRQHPGDVRFLNVGVRVTDRQQRLWPREETDTCDGARNAIEGVPYRDSGGVAAYTSSAGVRFPFLPAGLCDLADLARGERNPGAPGEGVPCRGDHRPVSMLFEQRCADAFRALGFVVRELGQGCGRVAYCLALAPADRFGVILDAKARRDGYTLGTDDRQFCDYARRHSRELSQSGIDRVYFIVLGAGFRRHDLENLAGYLVAEPIRSVCFLEAHALMRLVNDSIRDRATFHLAGLEPLVFGNKIIEE
jgi:hypothetical protein